MASVVINGDTSGSVTLQAPAAAGATVLTLPSTSGTIVITSGAQTIEFADGSVSAPSITNSGDTNTGIFFPAADTIAFAEGGVEAMRIDSSGNVGIGINPASKLTIAGTTADATAQATYVGTIQLNEANLTTPNAVGGIEFKTSVFSGVGYGSKIVGHNNGALLFATRVNSATFTETMRIDSAGNVGIGTSSPVNLLTIESTSNVRATIRNSTENTSYASSLDFATGSGSLSSSNVVGRVIGLITQADPSTLQSALSFHTNSGDSVSEKMRIDSSGNVGIGTSSPSSKLEISSTSNTGFMALSSYAGLNGNVFRATSTSGIPHLALQSWSTWTTAKDVAQIRFDGLTSTGGYTEYAGIYAAAGTNTSTGAPTALFFSTSNGSSTATERMRIDSSGNVLVGTTAQQTGGNGKLSVAGGTDGVAGTFTNNSNGNAYTLQVYNYTTATGGGTGRFMTFRSGSTPTQVGTIVGDGTNTAYNTSSDYRLKENIEPMAGALALVMQQRPVTWVWKSNGKLGKGFIAHWLQEDGAGECVSGEKDAVDADGNPEYQGVDTSFLVATLTAAIQEQQTIINDLKARVTALEAK